MKLLRLPEGERAPADVDSIGIERLDGGRFALAGTVFVRGDPVLIGADRTYETRGLAEAAGAAWAERNGVQMLYVGSTAARLAEASAA